MGEDEFPNKENPDFPKNIAKKYIAFPRNKKNDKKIIKKVHYAASLINHHIRNDSVSSLV